MLGKTVLAVSFIAGAIGLADTLVIAFSEAKTAIAIPDYSENHFKNNIAQLSADTNKSKYTGIVGTVDKIAEQITVRIATPEINSFGSGVIIARDGNTYYVATAAHVLEGKKQYQIITNDGETYSLNNQTIVESDAYDFAIFSFTSEKDYTVATIGDYEVGTNRNQVLFVSGFPKEKSPQRIITGGKVRQQNSTNFLAKDSYSLQNIGQGLLYSNLSYKGMSGGAVLDSEGNLVGINTGAENELYSDESGNYEELSLGFSLGVAIQDVFNFLNRETPLNRELLQTTNESAAEVAKQDLDSIQAQLLNVEPPNNNTDLAAWMNYGNQLWRYGRYREAIDAFEKVAAIDPNFDRAYYAKGLAYWYQNNFNQAVNALEKATQLNANPYYYWRYLGYSYQELDRFDEAISAYEQAIAKSPEDFVLYVELGNTLGDSKRYDEAIDSYNKASSLNRDHPWIYLNRGHFYEEQEKSDLALSDYDKAISLDPQLAQAYSNRGSIYKDKGQDELALSDYNQAIKLDPQLSLAYYNRGNLYFKQGQGELALSDYNQTISIDPEYAPAYNNRGLVYYEKKGQPELALPDYNQAIKLDPEYAPAFYNRGNYYRDREQSQLAIADYTQAIKLNPQLSQAYNNRGLVYLVQQKAELAIADFEQLLQFDSNDANAYFGLGLVHFQANNIQDAKTNLQKAQQLYLAQNNTANAQIVANFLNKLP